jgi:hypothetical protein
MQPYDRQNGFQAGAVALALQGRETNVNTSHDVLSLSSPRFDSLPMLSMLAETSPAHDLGPLFSSFGYLFSALLGGAFSLGTILATTVWNEKVKQDSERKRLAATFAGELEGVVNYLVTHNVEELLRTAVKSPGPHKLNVQKIVPLRGSFLGASGKIDTAVGFLPPNLAAESAKILVHIRGTIEEFTTVHNAWKDTWWVLSGFRDFCVSLADMVKKCKDDAGRLIPLLKAEAMLDRAPSYPP